MKTKKQVTNRMLVIFLCITMIFTQLPLAVFAADTDGSEPQAELLYSGDGLTIDAVSGPFDEADGAQTLTLRRTEKPDSEQSYTVLLYDNSANYGLDYRLWHDETLAEKKEGATSIYDSFRDNGQETGGLEFDLQLTAAKLLEQESDEGQEDISASDMLNQLDELGVRAAELQITFAVGQETAELTLEMLDDSENEYEETFLLAVLDKDGLVIESAQLVCAIADDEPTPTVEVSFNCEDELELNPESGEAELVFKRTGNLATSTMVALCVNGTPMGWVDFAPWQENQTAWVVEEGIYTMLDSDGFPLDGAVTVVDNTPVSMDVLADGADPVLDAVPDSYNSLPAMVQAPDSSWLPDWAKGGSYENKSEIVVMGSATSNNIFPKHGSVNLGDITYFSGGANFHDLNTSGTGSGCIISMIDIQSDKVYDVTGIESVTTYVKMSGINNKGAELELFAYKGPSQIKRVTENSYYTLTLNMNDKDQSSYAFGFDNNDYTNIGRGCHAYVPNGFKMNKRTYCFQIANSSATPLHYEGSTAVGGVLPTIDGNDAMINVTMGNTNESRVNIVYRYDSYPAVLTGFKLYNSETRVTSGVISLSTGNSGTNNGSTQNSSSFLFDKTFLNKYEKTYCWLGTVNGVKRHMFTIIPVYEKIPVKYTIENSVGGKIKLENSALYRGDTAVFKDDGTSAAKLSGVWYTAKSDLSGAMKSGTVDADSDGKVRIKLGPEYSNYTFEGVYNSQADKLLVYYGEGQSANGKLEFNEGTVLSGKNYVKDEYYPLIATPRAGYIAKWISCGREFYGNTFYYQLDGNANHNFITLEFVPENSAGMVTTNLTGVLSIADVDLRTKYASSRRMAYTQFFITSDTTYNTVTDANGEFRIENFKGVPGKTYSMMVSYDGAIGYATFVLDKSGMCNITMPQFSTGMAFPDSVSVTLDGTGGNSNMIQLRSGANVKISARVYAPVGSVKVKEVYFHFMSNPICKSDGTYDSVEKMVLKANAYTTSDDDNYSSWSLDIPAEELTGNTNLYVSVVSEATVLVESENGMTTTVVQANSGKVNGGYAFISPITDTTIPVHYDIPATPSMQDASSIDLESLGIPLVGNLDISLSSKTGGFFVQRTDPITQDTILVCGHSFTTSYAVGNISTKYEAAKKTHDAIMKTASNSTPAGGSDAQVSAANNGKNSPSPFTFSPVFMFKLVASKDANGGPSSFTAYEMALGIDSFYFRNIPFNVYGVPMYIALSFTLEAYMEWALSIKPGVAENMSDLIELFGKLAIGDDTAEAQTEDQMFFAAPVFKFGAKGGAGYNAFLSLFVELTVSAPFIVQAHPEWDAAVKLGFDINVGADLLVFTGKLPLVQLGTYFGKDELIADLKAITPQTVASTPLKASAEDEAALPDMGELFNSVTFTPSERVSNLRRTSAGAGTVASNAFKNTQVQLVNLEDGNIMAFFLQDTHEQDTMNYLSAAYVISNDGGNTWGDIQYLDDQTNNDVSSLQYDINIFELNDRLLVTWSESDLDKMISEMDLDVENLTASQVGKLMASMNLKGIFINKTDGTVIGDPFTIAENSTVACGALDAVQNGDMVYIYYQRNTVPQNDDMTLMELVSLERTIAMARANVNNPDEWTSTSVRAMGEEGQQYRITEVEPFVHDGIMGEILVLDRDGKLAIYNAYDESWTSSVEDRQLYLRTYDFDAETGEPIPSALMNITDYSACAQSPQVVSNDSYLHLFWNQDGNIVYTTDFVATSFDHEAVQEGAYVVRNVDGTVTTHNPGGNYNVSNIANSDTLHVGTKFSASMADDGNVLLCWVADDPNAQTLLPTDEIYGVILNTVSNAEAVRLSDATDYEIGDANEYIYQLSSVGAPVALTSEDSLIGALDSLCLESGENNKFLLAFTKLNSEMRSNVTAADIMVVQSEDTPELEILDVSAPTYPMPGSDMTVYVTVANNGLETATDVNVTASGIGNGATAVEDSLLPGCDTVVALNVAVPADFNQTTALDIAVDCSNSEDTQTTSVDILYSAHFIPLEMPAMNALANSTDCLTDTMVKNIGNAPGTPTITYLNTIFGSETEGKEYTYISDVTVVPGGEIMVTHLLENTLMNAEKTAYLTVSTGDDYDQSVQSFMPATINSVVYGDAKIPDASNISAISDAVDGYDLATVTADDKADLEQLLADIEELLEFTDFTDEEISELNGYKTAVMDLLAKIEGTGELINKLTGNVDGYKDETVKSTDKDALEQIIKDINILLDTENLTEDEEKALEEAKEKAEGLLGIIGEAAKATDTENTEKVKDVTAENVTPEDKTDLEKAKADLEKALEDSSGNYTENEKKTVEDEIKRIDGALEVIGNVEEVEDKINNLPDTVGKDDEAAINAADDAYNALTDYEKSLVDKDAKQKLNDAKAALEELIKPADPDSPATGDCSNLWLWLVVLIRVVLQILRNIPIMA